MAGDNDDERDDLDTETLDVRGAMHPSHLRLRDIAHGLVHELEASAVIVIMLRDRGVVSSTMLHCSVAESEHPTVGADLTRGLYTCIDQLTDALINDGGNRGQGGTH